MQNHNNINFKPNKFLQELKKHRQGLNSKYTSYLGSPHSTSDIKLIKNLPDNHLKKLSHHISGEIDINHEDTRLQKLTKKLRSKKSNIFFKNVQQIISNEIEARKEDTRWTQEMVKQVKHYKEFIDLIKDPNSNNPQQDMQTLYLKIERLYPSITRNQFKEGIESLHSTVLIQLNLSATIGNGTEIAKSEDNFLQEKEKYLDDLSDYAQFSSVPTERLVSHREKFTNDLISITARQIPINEQREQLRECWKGNFTHLPEQNFTLPAESLFKELESHFNNINKNGGNESIITDKNIKRVIQSLSQSTKNDLAEIIRVKIVNDKFSNQTKNSLGEIRSIIRLEYWKDRFTNLPAKYFALPADQLFEKLENRFDGIKRNGGNELTITNKDIEKFLTNPNLTGDKLKELREISSQKSYGKDEEHLKYLASRFSDIEMTQKNSETKTAKFNITANLSHETPTYYEAPSSLTYYMKKSTTICYGDASNIPARTVGTLISKRKSRCGDGVHSAKHGCLTKNDFPDKNEAAQVMQEVREEVGQQSWKEYLLSSKIESSRISNDVARGN